MEVKMASANASSGVNHVDNNKYQYSKVSLSLENCILPPEKLFPSPSQFDGLELDAETELRILGCELIQTSGILLRLPQVAMATGQVLFQRFYYSKSFVRHSMEVVAMSCITLASKIEEAPRRIRDVINVFHHIKQVKSGKTIQPLILDQNYINLKNQVIKAERRVLKELGFCVHVKHPHKDRWMKTTDYTNVLHSCIWTSDCLQKHPCQMHLILLCYIFLFIAGSISFGCFHYFMRVSHWKVFN